MREIKFRAWDGTRMILFDKFGFSNTGGFWGGTREVWSMQSYFSIGECEGFGYYHDDFAKDVECLILMQFTGLKDKNGVDIYEGDVLDNYEPVTDKSGSICFVVWDIITFAVESTGSQAIDVEPVLFYTESEVIGNIHENKHLTS